MTTEKKYRTSKNGLVRRMYARQRMSSKERGQVPPTYSADEFIDWIYSQKKFHVLYDNWKRLDFQKDYVPSVDRKDDRLGYTMANIQIMTWKENKEKGEHYHQIGKNSNDLKPVIQLTIDGDFVAEFISQSEAARQTGIDNSYISGCCRGKNKSAKGYKWKYKILE